MAYRALITGSSSGIGFEYAKHLSEKGWNLDLVSQDKDRSLRIKAKITV
jgi:short-subunit dehydrogenase